MPRFSKRKNSLKLTGYSPVVPDKKGRGVLTDEELHKRYRLHQIGKSSAAPADPSAKNLRSAQLDRGQGLEMVSDFLSRLLGIDKHIITRYTDLNIMYEKGDLALPYSNKNIEVKVRAINPDRYPMNHVGLGVLKFDPRHQDGLKELACKLGIDVQILETATVREFGFDSKESYQFGHPEHFSLSSHSLLNSVMTIYVNYRQGHIYLYTQEEIRKHIVNAITTTGLRKGQGGEEPNLISVLIPLARWRFSKDKNGLWRYTGLVSESVEQEKQSLKNYLS